jgi:flavodoxin
VELKVLIVYDSYFGNTEKIAHNISFALGDNVQVRRPIDVNMASLSELDLLVVGAPTRAFRPSDSIRDFLKKIPSGVLSSVKVASFDTRVDIEAVGNPILKIMVRLFGYAAKPIINSLERKGGLRVSDPTGFYVLDTEGPLADGELEKASAWAASLIAHKSNKVK